MSAVRKSLNPIKNMVIKVKFARNNYDRVKNFAERIMKVVWIKIMTLYLIRLTLYPDKDNTKVNIYYQQLNRIINFVQITPQSTSC